ncbi:myb-like protein X [Galleria mellonella]|uniref:Myb-like protein X n=1 Tax=Galleria mellonella TaxID=7137 RepID=A0ABM3N644_GALME|nr:myb-like protein X [Galleria mellonella]
MSNTSYPQTEMDDNLCTEPELATCDHRNLDYINHWVSQTIENEVNRGVKLREEKSRVFPPAQHECISNLKFIKIPTCPKNNRYNRKYSSRHYTDIRRSPCSSRFNSAYISNLPPQTCLPQTCYSKANFVKLRTRTQRCPMRIAELAVPTKRQCIDTWRNKCDVLPEFMVERLRRQVMDEKPVVEISDAITCFKRRKSSFNRSELRTCTYETMNVANADFQNYSIAFGQKIARKLNNPLNITLNPRLEKISNIVSSDISRLTKHRKKSNINNSKNKKIQFEMSKKIAAWIANIIEESSYKLLEEDLKELEEEEGPVLDFIDILIDNVVNICEPNLPENIQNELDINLTSPVLFKDLNLSGSQLMYHMEESEKINNNDGTLQDISDKIQDSYNGSLDNNNIKEDIEIDTIEEYMFKELEKIIDSITIIEEPKNQNMIVETEHDLGEKNISQQSIEQTNQLIDHKDSADENDEYSDVPEDIMENIDAEYNFHQSQENSNVSDLFPIHSEESHDENNRKVNFIQITNKVTEVPAHTHDYRKIKSDKEQIRKPPIHFAPPNENLLSKYLNNRNCVIYVLYLGDADELWPADITTPTLKASASVSKSITSLGKIIENDERLLSQDDTAKQIANGLQETLKIEHIEQRTESIMNKEISLEENNLQYIENNNNKEILKRDSKTNKTNNLEYSTSDATTDTIIDVTNTYKKEMGLKSTPINESFRKETTLDNPLDKRVDNLNKDRDTNSTDNVIFNTQNIPNKILEAKFEYRVNLNTAPSWVRKEQGKGEPGEDSFYRQSRAKLEIKESVIRKWNKDLRDINANLDLWNVWVEKACKNIIDLKKKKETNIYSSNTIKRTTRDWLKLKKSMDTDIILWTKLNQQAQRRLKTYKTIYNKNRTKIGSAKYNILKCSCMKQKL